MIGINPLSTATMPKSAASAIGLVVAKRATFAAELAGCQPEIGAAAAMAAISIQIYITLRYII